MNNVIRSFTKRLEEQNVSIGEDESDRAEVVVSERADGCAVRFRGKWLELWINYELLDADLDPHMFVLLNDKEQIAHYVAVADPKDNRPVKTDYAYKNYKYKNEKFTRKEFIQ